MKFLLVMAVLWSGSAFATTTHLLEIRFLSFSAYEAVTLVVDAQVQGEAGQSTKLQIQGVVSRPAHVIVGVPGAFHDRAALVSHVQDTYCKREHIPAGVSTFNAGKMTASLGDYIPAWLKIEINYYDPPIPGEVPLPGDSFKRKTSLVCPNSMTE